VSDDRWVTGTSRTQHPRTGRRWWAGAALPVVVALALTSCGTIPPEPAATRTPHLFSPSAPAASSAAPTPAAASSPTPSTASPTPTPSPKPSKGARTAPPDTWVGHFRGKEVRVPRGHGASVSFTFDDGPWPGSTTKVLALLKQNHVHATFCLIGNQAKAYPSLVRREVAEGHELCDHSRDHDLTMGRKGAKYIDAEVGDGLAQIRRAAPPGTPVRLYRQPGGLWNPAVVKAMDKRALYPLRWSADPRDWSRPGSATIVRRVVKGLHPGVVILMHDGGGDRSQSVEALKFLLHAVVAAGWKPVLAPHVKLSAKAAARPQ
jgi:peptidoglycan-N-acetylglucosamine deacetylase